MITISAFRKSKSFPARAFARADGYQRLESGAPENPAKYPPGRALPRTEIDCEVLHVASIVITTFDWKFAAQISTAFCNSFLAQSGKLM